MAVIVGMMFVIKAGILSGSFYFQAAAMFVAALLMAQMPDYSHFILGIVASACFFFLGLLCKETHDHTIRFAPPLVIKKDEVDWALERIRAVFDADTEKTHG